jgi:hypothetical protein
MELQEQPALVELEATPALEVQVELEVTMY